VSPVPLQVGQGGVESPCGTSEPSLGADVLGVSRVSVPMWHGVSPVPGHTGAQPWCRCGQR
jgi:hypothetical protein